MHVHNMSSIISIIALIFLANFCQGSKYLTKRNKVIIDTDAGSDDAIALLVALSIPEKAQVLAITCTYGNTWLENVEKNVLKTLTITNQSHIPVYSGAKTPLLRNFKASKHFGVDGMGDFKFNKQIVATIDRTKHAALAMIDLVKRYPGEVSIVSLGPTTNVALAMSLDPTFEQNVKRFYAMGSTPNKIGFNFSLDPESNAIFFKAQTKETKIIISSTLANQCMVSRNWRWDVLGRINSDIIRFANKAELKASQRELWRYADLITIAAFLWPELVTKSAQASIVADTCNEEPGGVVFAYGYDNNVEFVTKFDVKNLEKQLLRHFA